MTLDSISDDITCQAIQFRSGASSPGFMELYDLPVGGVLIFGMQILANAEQTFDFPSGLRFENGLRFETNRTGHNITFFLR